MSLERLLALRERPEGKPLMYQSWHSLTFLHWRFDPAIVQAMLPPGLILDTWEGEAYFGLVPFKMVNVRFARGYSVIGARDFPETNVRTYVIGPDGNPGVWFFSLDAYSPHAAAGGRILYGLPYHFATMGVGLTDEHASYDSMRRQAHSLVKTTLPKSFSPAEPGTMDFWLAERYLLYSRRRGQLWSGQVHHAPYPLAQTTAKVKQTMLNRIGLEASGEPLAHFSPGVDVEVFRLKPAV